MDVAPILEGLVPVDSLKEKFFQYYFCGDYRSDPARLIEGPLEDGTEQGNALVLGQDKIYFDHITSSLKSGRITAWVMRSEPGQKTERQHIPSEFWRIEHPFLDLEVSEGQFLYRDEYWTTDAAFYFDGDEVAKWAFEANKEPTTKTSHGVDVLIQVAVRKMRWFTKGQATIEQMENACIDATEAYRAAYLNSPSGRAYSQSLMTQPSPLIQIVQEIELQSKLDSHSLYDMHTVALPMSRGDFRRNPKSTHAKARKVGRAKKVDDAIEIYNEIFPNGHEAERLYQEEATHKVNQVMMERNGTTIAKDTLFREINLRKAESD